MYEVQRKPHEVVTDSSLLNISPRALHSELMCPICLDLMKNAQTTKEVRVEDLSLFVIIFTIILMHFLNFTLYVLMNNS